MSLHKKFGDPVLNPKILTSLKKKKKKKKKETHKKCYINPTYIFRIFCIKNNDNQ